LAFEPGVTLVAPGVILKMNSSPPTLRFGVFELDARSGELRKQGIKIRLQGQPVEILAMLLEHPGEIITRDELQKKLWPANTFVDFEQGLNNAIKRLRAALDDNPENPRFIETLPRHGYRFVGSVKSADSSSAETAPTRGLGTAIRLSVFVALVLVAASVGLVGLNVFGLRDRLFARASKTQIQALAVLPLTNLSGNPDQEYFADGMTEALITELGKINTPRVISRQSVMQYKGSKKPLQEIARELNVDAVLEGAVERSGERVRVTIHLVQVSPESQLWANHYDRDIRDVLRLQEKIARTVTDEIEIKLTSQERASLASARSVDPEAHDDYLRGRYLLGTLPDIRYSKYPDESPYTEVETQLQIAIGYFKQAIEKEPGYASAYAGLAAAYMGLGIPTVGSHAPKEILPEVKAAATKAVELDPSLGEAHFALAQIAELYDWNWSEADKEFRLALTLNPNHANAHLEYGRFLQALGRESEVFPQIDYAIELDPLDLRTRALAAYVTYASRQYELAIKQFESLGDGFGLGWAYREKGMYPQAVATLERYVNQVGRCSVCLSSLAEVYGFDGRKGEALKLIDELKKRARQRYVSGFFFAEAYLGLGERDQALTWLERAYEDRDPWMVYINSYPGLDPLRSEPRFQTLLRRMNFPP
jgi:TolB-like protein/DNA-binding winged helix-turn-helix (wHTH) protein